RGLGNSRIPLLAVGIAAVCNIFLDLLLVRGFHMGAAGAATATVASQAFSMLLSLALIRRISLPFMFDASMIRFNGNLIRQIVG
ncbi:MAG: polysaccharide biosynthesis C-terminal domain-containing protein, partial [Erysipelotrichaceae bacterium]|nr:polysaccharide biosynthesis C-terminal domain-containing protein [Erysipelotrichaceae bacterium]